MARREKPAKRPVTGGIAALASAAAAARGVRARADALNALAEALREADPPRALRAANEALRIAGSGGYPAGEARGRLLRARVKFHQGRFASAGTDAKVALQYYAASGDRQGEMLTLRVIGNIYYQLSKYAKAEQFYRLSRTCAAAAGDELGALSAEVGVAYVLNIKGRPGEAVRLLSAKRALMERAPAETRFRWRFIVMVAHRSTGDFKGALRENEALLREARRAGNRLREAAYLMCLAENLVALGRLARAEPLFRESLRLADQLEISATRCDAHYGLGDLALRRKDAKQAERHFNDCLAVARDNRIPLNAAMGLIGLSGVCLLQGDAAQALTRARRAMRLAEAGGDREMTEAARRRIDAARAALAEAPAGRG